MTERTVLIGLDGATFTILDTLFQEGVMPFLAELSRSGVKANLRTVIPALTPPAWTSLVTGRSPGQHGIFDFFQKTSPQSHTLRFLTSRDVAGETIWSLANQGGKRAIALNFLLTYPAPAIDGYVVPGWMPWKQLRLGCHPRNLYDRIKALPGFEPRELAMDMAHEEKALEGCPPDEYLDWIDWHTRREQQWFQILAMLLAEQNPCELVTILFDGVDKLQHLFWRFIDPAYSHTLQSAWEGQVRERCLEYYRQLDSLLANIVHLVGQEASIILASDHGFGPQERTFFANAWLAERGYLTWAEGGGPQSSEAQRLGIGQIARHGYLLDWERTRAYAPMPSSNGIHIVRASEAYPGGVPEEKYEAFRNQLIDELLAIKDLADGQPVVDQVWPREAIFDGPRLALAPDLTLVLRDGGLISILGSDAVVKPRPQPSGTHRPDGIFIAQGAGFKSGTRLPELSILDVAPLILYSLDLPIPEELASRLPLTVLEPSTLQARPMKTIRQPGLTDENLRQADGAPALDEETEAALMERLRALGYVE